MVRTHANWAVHTCLSPVPRWKKGQRVPVTRCEGEQLVHDMETHIEPEVRLGVHPDLDPKGTRDFPMVCVVLSHLVLYTTWA